MQDHSTPVCFGEILSAVLATLTACPALESRLISFQASRSFCFSFDVISPVEGVYNYILFLSLKLLLILARRCAPRCSVTPPLQQSTSSPTVTSDAMSATSAAKPSNDKITCKSLSFQKKKKLKLIRYSAQINSWSYNQKPSRFLFETFLVVVIRQKSQVIMLRLTFEKIKATTKTVQCFQQFTTSVVNLRLCFGKKFSSPYSLLEWIFFSGGILHLTMLRTPLNIFF